MLNNSDANTAVPEQLLLLSAALPDPSSYYEGAQPEVSSLPVNMVLFSRKRFAPGHEADNQHYRFMLISCLRTSGAVCVNECLHYLQEGEALLVFPHQLHHYGLIDLPLQWVFATFEHDQASCLRPLRDTPVRLSAGALAALIELLQAHRAQADAYAGLRMSMALATILQEMLTAAGKKPGPLGGDEQALEVVERVNQAIYQRLREPLQIGELAQAAGVSGSHLRYLFRSQLGISLGRYIRKVKVHQAMALLRTTGRSVGSVARACGFASLPAFSRTFKQLTGESPQAYRQRMGGGG